MNDIHVTVTVVIKTTDRPKYAANIPAPWYHAARIVLREVVSRLFDSSKA